MDLNKHNLMLWGVLLLFFGLQFHYFDSFVLTEKASTVYYKRFEKKEAAKPQPSLFLKEAPQSVQRKTIKPPEWLGRCLMSVGGVLIFQSFVARKIESSSKE